MEKFWFPAARCKDEDGAVATVEARARGRSVEITVLIHDHSRDRIKPAHIVVEGMEHLVGLRLRIIERNKHRERGRAIQQVSGEVSKHDASLSAKK
jgi:hypothetical protein